jgi:hypothetical protein
MFRACLTILLALACASTGLDAQSRNRKKTPARSSAAKPKPKPAAAAPPVREPPLMQCPSILGNGLTSQRLYCDVLSGADAASGLRVTLPPHAGTATLYFTLHNRQTYSESEVKAGQAFARYTATLRIARPTGEALGTAVVQSEFRTARDLVERIGGGAGPGGAKAVAPTGAEAIAFTLPEGVNEVVLLGDRLIVERLAGREVITGTAAPGRPLAIVSQVEIEYRPAPGAKKPQATDLSPAAQAPGRAAD